MWLAFLDGERAYTRPPPVFLLDGLADVGVGPTGWLAADTLLGKMKACLKLKGKYTEHGEHLQEWCKVVLCHRRSSWE